MRFDGWIEVLCKGKGFEVGSGGGVLGAGDGWSVGVGLLEGIRDARLAGFCYVGLGWLWV